MAWIPNGTYTILNLYTRSVLQPSFGDSTPGTYVAGSAQFDPQYQQWNVIYVAKHKGWVLQNVDSGKYASTEQISGPFNGYDTLQMNDEPSYFTFELGTDNGAYFIIPEKPTPRVLDQYEYQATGPIILAGKDQVSPHGAPPLKGSGNQQWCFLVSTGVPVPQ